MAGKRSDRSDGQSRMIIYSFFSSSGEYPLCVCVCVYVHACVRACGCVFVHLAHSYA